MSAARPVRRQHQDIGAKPCIVIWEATRACPLAFTGTGVRRALTRRAPAAATA